MNSVRFTFAACALTLAIISPHAASTAVAAAEISAVPGTAAADANTAAAWVRRGDQLMQQSRESLDVSLYARAEEAYEKALTIDPRCTPAMLGLAWVHNSEHEFSTGRRWAEAALAIDPQSSDAHALLGDRAVELGEYEEAFEHFQEAVDLRPDLASYSRAAHLLWLTGQPVRARSLMQRAIAAGGPAAENTAWCRAQLALMLCSSGDHTAAERVAAHALDNAPANVQVRNAAGRVTTARRDYSAAIAHYERSVAITPNHDALAALVDLYRLTGRSDDAEKQFAAVLAFHAAHAASHPHGHEHAHGYGNAQLARFLADHDRDLDMALHEAKAAYDAFPNVFAADTLAWCYFKIERFADAAEMIRRALRWNTPGAEIHFHAGLIFAGLGDHALAKQHLAQALHLDHAFHPCFPAEAARTLETLASSASAPGEPAGEWTTFTRIP